MSEDARGARMGSELGHGHDGNTQAGIRCLKRREKGWTLSQHGTINGNGRR